MVEKPVRKATGKRLSILACDVHDNGKHLLVTKGGMYYCDMDSNPIDQPSATMLESVSAVSSIVILIQRKFHSEALLCQTCHLYNGVFSCMLSLPARAPRKTELRLNGSAQYKN